MATLPLETNPNFYDPIKKQHKGRDLYPLIMSGTMLLGVSISEAISLWHLLFVLLFSGGLLVMICRQYQRFYLAIMIIAAFTAGAVANYVEKYHHQVTPIPQSQGAFIEAVIVKHEQQANGRARLWLDDVRLEGDAIAGRVRATIDQMPGHDFGLVTSRPMRFKGRLRLYPVSGALFPGWPDYSRKSWREGIIASAYGRAPKITLSPHDVSTSRISQMRQVIRGHITADLSPASAHLAKALLIGERDFSHKVFYNAFRQAGLAHLLAISGLHMGLFCFGVYSFCRLILAMPVRLSAMIAPHKLAALCAIASGLSYLTLAGMPISAIRAYFMVSLVLVALLIDRRMVTIRSMTLVFCGFLLLYPSALYQPAFQLSFAATFGIALFHDGQKAKRRTVQNSGKRRVFYVAATSAIAIASTFFITAFHFGTISAWGIVSNIVAIPYTGLVIMPVGIAYLLSMPFGFSSVLAPFFEVILQALILFAQLMASLPLSDIRLPTPPPIYLPLFAIIGAALFYANRKGQLCFVFIGVLAICLWLGQGRPFGVMTGEGQFRRIAFFEAGTLYHTHRLTDFWAQSYAKLFGPYDDTVRLNCRTSCTIYLHNAPYHIHFAPHDSAHCQIGTEALILTYDSICHKQIRPYDNSGNISLLLYKNNMLGVYFKQ